MVTISQYHLCEYVLVCRFVCYFPAVASVNLNMIHLEREERHWRTRQSIVVVTQTVTIVMCKMNWAVLKLKFFNFQMCERVLCLLMIGRTWCKTRWWNIIAKMCGCLRGDSWRCVWRQCDMAVVWWRLDFNRLPLAEGEREIKHFGIVCCVVLAFGYFDKWKLGSTSAPGVSGVRGTVTFHNTRCVESVLFIAICVCVWHIQK